MSRRARSTKRRAPSRAQRRSFDLFGPPALIDGEDPAIYEELVAQVSAALNPNDVIAEMLIDQLVNAKIELDRYLRFKVQLLRTRPGSTSLFGLAYAAHKRFECSWEDFQPLLEGWLDKDPEVVADVDATFAEAGLTREALVAGMFFDKLDVFSKLEDMISSAKACFFATLRELDRHEAMLGRKQLERIEDASRKKDLA